MLALSADKRKNKKFLWLLAAAVIFLISAEGTVFAFWENSQDYYPVSTGNTLYFNAYKANDPECLIKMKAEIVGEEKSGGEEYYYFNAPEISVRFLIRKDKNGVFMRVMKYPFPVFSFMSLDVVFEPEMRIIEFPLKQGNTWQYEGTATAMLFGLFKITRNIKASFEILKRETLETAAGKIDAYCVRLLLDEGDGLGFREEKHWYGYNIGYVKAETVRHKAEITGYSVKDENKGIFTHLPSDGIELYK